jgi:hypothetical protein
MATNIYARSPFIIEVNEVGQSGSKVELYIYPNGTTPPTSPTYTLQKLIPASNNTQTLYNVSPYLLEAINHNNFVNNYATDNALLGTEQYTMVQIKRYKLLVTSYVLLDTFTYQAFDGYGYYSEGMNPMQLENYHLNEKNYFYWADANNNPSVNPLERAGTFTAYLPTGYTVEYEQLQTGLTHSYTIASDNVYNLYRVRPAYYLTGNILRIKLGLAVVWESTFYPIEECLYEPVVIDFINKFGAWQREFMFKASYESLATTATEFNLMQEFSSPFASYDPDLNQRQTFNTNGIISYRVNTGWVDETFSNNLQQLLLSERILLNGMPVKMKTKELEKQKNINTKQINYPLEFESSTDLINNVI